MNKSICCGILTAVLLGLVLTACDNEKPKTNTVGVINIPALDQVLPV